jgi:hypothetical protein
MSGLRGAVVFMLFALPAAAHSQAFETISLQPARTSDPRNMRMRVLANGDLNASGLPVLVLVSYAYDVPLNASPRLSGLPAWRETYDIEAKAPANAVPAGLSEREKRRRTQAMIWSFIHIDDAAEATSAAIARSATGLFNIVDDEPAPVSEWLPFLAQALGARKPRTVPTWLARLLIGEGGVSMMTQIRGCSNANAKRELGWQPRFATWRRGFVEGLG